MANNSSVGRSVRRHLLDETKAESLQYSKEDIENIDDFDDAFDIGENMGVDMSGLDGLDETKQRLLMHLEKSTAPNYKSQVAKDLANIRRNDRKKKTKLKDLLLKFNEELKEFEFEEKEPEKHGKRGSAAIEGLLKTEGTTKNLLIDFQDKIRRTENDECIVVVSGETSAGKSSFLNLLFGEKILPTHHNPCTSVITRIAFSKERTAKIIFKDGRQPLVFDDLDGNKEKWKVLWDMIEEKDVNQREMATVVQEVQIFVPAELLKCGLVLVDSPGIGENDAMDEVITQFVDVNDIMGFLYIIKSDNSGGVDEDRLGSLLKVITEKQKKKTEEGVAPFDPKCAIFVCNMWDLVKEQERNEVYQYAVRKLGLYWPGLTDTQVVTMSAKRAQREVDIDPYFVLPEYRHFLNDLKELYAKASDKVIKTTYKWLENILVRSVHHLKTIVRGIDRSEQDLATKMEGIHQRLTKLRDKSEKVFSSQRVKLDAEYKEITTAFKEELHKPQVHFRVCQFLDSEAPRDETYDTIKSLVKQTVLQRIMDEFCKWEEENERIEGIQRLINHEMKTELNILQEDIQKIENDLHSDTDSISSGDFTMDVSENRRRSVTSLRGSTKTVRSVFETYMMDTDPYSVRFVTKFLHPVDKGRSILRGSVLYDFAVSNRKLADYKKDPRKGAKKMAEKYLQQVINPGVKDEDIIGYLVDNNMEKPREILHSVEESIPGLIQSNEELMDHISMCRVSQRGCREMYEKMMVNLEHLKNKLMEYGSGYIYVDDFVGQQISLSDEFDGTLDRSQFKVSDIIFSSASEKEATRRNVPRGLWTLLQNGYLSADGGEETTSIAIKVYLPLSGIKEVYAEITKLRLLDHEHVAKFLGIKHSDSEIPAFVFDEHLKSLRRYKMTTFASMQDEVPRLLNEVVDGIEYLHSKNLVHMELNMYSITVNLNGDVKLTGGCLPRVATFPMGKESISVGEFVYLSPAVLRGETYVACADIYALGLLIYELLFDRRAFDNHRVMTLDRFTERVDPVTMLEIDTVCRENNVSESTKNLIKWCVDLKADARPRIQVLKEHIKQVGSEGCIAKLKRHKTRAPIRKRSGQLGQSGPMERT